MLTNLKRIEAVDVYLARIKTREYVGRLSYKNEKFIFTYDDSYLNNKRSISLGPDLPLSKKEFVSTQLFPTFHDRIPSRENPAYEEYCKMAGIDVSEKRPLILLGTLGSKGPSSFVFAPVFKVTFNNQDVKRFRELLKLTVREFGELFGFSPNTIHAIENNKSSGQDALKRLEIYYRFPEVALRDVMKNRSKINDEKSNYVEEFFLAVRLITQVINDSQYDIATPNKSIEITIDIPQPEPNRPNKRSKQLTFSFTRELIDDAILKNPTNYQKITNKVKRIFNEFDFSSNHERSQSQSNERYVINSDCTVQKTSNVN